MKGFLSEAQLLCSIPTMSPDALPSSPFTSHQLSFPAVSLFPQLLWLTLLTRPADSPWRALPWNMRYFGIQQSLLQFTRLFCLVVSLTVPHRRPQAQLALSLAPQTERQILPQPICSLNIHIVQRNAEEAQWHITLKVRSRAREIIADSGTLVIWKPIGASLNWKINTCSTCYIITSLSYYFVISLD